MKSPDLNLPFIVLCASLAAAAGVSIAARQAAPGQAAAKPAPPVLMKVAAGDLDGDGRAEIVSWDSERKDLVVWRTAGDVVQEASRHALGDFPTRLAIGDVDGDRKGELVVGQGLRGYNPKEGAQTNARVNVYQPLETGEWTPIEVYRKVTERPDITSLQVVDLDADRHPEILFSCFTEKYFVDVCAARLRAGAWFTDTLAHVRMGMSVAAGDALGDRRTRVVIGRPYGEAVISTGGAFVLDGERRVDLPAFRGVSSVALGDVTGDGRPDIVVGDGWHSNYGRIARGRIAILARTASGWDYQLLEDVPDHPRIQTLAVADIDGDGRIEILAHGERRNSLAGDVRLYQRTASGWRGATVARDVQGFALADVRGTSAPELVLTGRTPEVRTLDLNALAWDAALAPEVKTWEVDSAALVGNAAPKLSARQWFGSQPLTLEQLRGKVVLVDFWATWCKPCVETFPTLRKWIEKYGPEGLVVIGMTNLSSQTVDAVREFYERQKLPWPVAIDPDERTQMEYGVTAIPHSFIVDRSGVIRLQHKGGGPDGLAEMEKQIVTLLQRQDGR